MAWTSESVPSTGSNWTSETVSSFIGWTPESIPVTSWKRTGHFGWAVTSTETGSITYNSSFTITITFDEPVVDFDATDFSLINCTISSLAGSGKIYTATCSKSYFGQITVAILNNRVTDDKGNKNSIGTPFSINVQPTIMKSEWLLVDAERTIKLPLISGGNYEFDIDWGDGTLSTVTAWNQVIDEGGAAMTHTYASAGEKNIEIGGASNYTITGWQFNDDAALDKDKIRDISDWGPLVISTDRAFYGCSNLTLSATNAPTISSPDMSRTFDSASALTGGVANWNMANVTDMTRMFRNASNFNEDINSWDVTSVRYLDATFSDATVFNQPLGNWSTSTVERLQSCFNNAPRFNQDISNWNTANVNNMGGMFQTATDFNNGGAAGAILNPLDSWDTGKVLSMANMFKSASAFNQNVGSWNVTAVTSMVGMFQDASLFNNGRNAEINNWRPTSCDTFYAMFNQADTFDQSLSNWEFKPGGGVDCTHMFYGARDFNSPLFWGSQVLAIDTMEGMFAFTDEFNQDIGGWKTDNVTNMISMFYGAEKFNQNINGWDVSSVQYMQKMFLAGGSGISAFNQPLGNWNTSSVSNMSQMFQGAVNYDQAMVTSGSKWDVSNVTNMRSMFLTATAFDHRVDSWDTTLVETMSHMFAYCPNFNQPLNAWGIKTGNVENMASMFQQSTSFNQSLNSWDVSSVGDFGLMFQGATDFNGTVGNWNIKSSGTVSMYGMFNGCSDFNQDISNWDVSYVTNFANFLIYANNFSESNYNSLLIAWEADDPVDGLTFDGGDATHGPLGTLALNRLVTNHGWTIIDSDRGTDHDVGEHT
jgi:surface protein